ncbi:hypothetical protein B4077_3353 [Bacillus cereus]|uniref:Uncharacterized protein n=1 Tax=Bacillus cereus TaxID=1396 RepID=A0A0G8F3U0_BACCE|nr:hypothetical protein B4077_3353 [Bacillus cereus]
MSGASNLDTYTYPITKHFHFEYAAIHHKKEHWPTCLCFF